MEIVLVSLLGQVTVEPVVNVGDYVAAFGTALAVVVSAVVTVGFSYLVLSKAMDWVLIADGRGEVKGWRANDGLAGEGDFFYESNNYGERDENSRYEEYEHQRRHRM